MSITRNIIDFEQAEEWSFSDPKPGDHIRVRRMNIYSHHGIYVSDNEVIHFTGKDDDSVLDWSECEVIVTDLKQFLRGGILEVKVYNNDEYNDLYPIYSIISYARACVGDKGYNLVFNNCEHFANVCTLGRFRSKQVERVLKGKLPLKDDKGMGLFGGISGLFNGLLGRGSSGGGTRSTTTYEPDKVKVAEIERDTKIKLAGMENERIEIMKNARLDILEFETKSKMAIEQAKIQGFNVIAQTIVEMQNKLNEIAEKRLLIIENGSLQVIRDIENFYNELGTKIKEDNNKYTTEKLPEMLSILEKYDEGSVSHKLYMKRIEEDMSLQKQYCEKQIEAVANRQKQVIDGFLKSKERILEQTGQITAGMIETIQKQSFALENNQTSDTKVKMLSKEEQLTLQDKKFV